VAIKLMRRQYSADPIFVKRFESEARVTAGLNHPNIVKVFSFGEDRGLLYLAMEMVDQGSLDAVMQQLGKVPEDRVLEVGVQIAKGLQAGLEKGLIHRDIKPGNILFADEHTAKIVDFGLAVLVEKQHEEEGEVWATPYYVAPEKLEGGNEDFRSDMYSLAATLFHALAGRPPFIVETNSMSELKKIKSKPVHLLSFAPHVSNPTAYVIEKALAVKPEDRFASYEEFIENLEYARNELRKRPKVRARPLMSADTSASSGSWITILVILMVVAVGLIVAMKRNGGAAVIQQEVPAQPARTQAQEAEEAIVHYNEARFKLLNGQFRPAAAGFRELNAGGKLPEPTNSWSGFHEGLAELLDGRSVPARNAFARLGRKVGEPGALEEKSNAFFRKFAALATEKEVVQVADAEGFERKSYEALALLALGLKDWEAGAHAEGVALLRQFQAAEPEGSSSWVGEYRPLVTPILEEHGLFSSLVEDLSKWESNPERAEAALLRIPELKKKIRAMGLRADLRRIEEELAPKVVAAIAAAKEAHSRKMAEFEAADEKILTDVKLRMKALCDSYQFRDALLAIKSADVKSEKHIAERELLAKRVEWLVLFKEQLIRDLTAVGYAGSLMRKNGTSLPGGVAGATETHLNIRFGAGNAMVQWNEVTPASVLGMAKSFFTPTLPADALATRQWQAGVFCIFTELYNESQLLMGEAAIVNEEYRLHKALFFGQPAEPAPTPAPAPAPAPQAPTAGNEAPGTGLEMLNNSLNPNKRNSDETMIKGLRRPTQ
jgi:eukaryotic-like serine/threonine-protein kinase